MGASSADYGIVAVLQFPYKGITACGFCCGLYFSIGCSGFSHADVFPYRFIKQIVVLRDERSLFIELAKRDVLQVMSAQRDPAFFHIPEPCDQLCDR